MKTKTIPFNKELAEKIQACEIEGKIKTKDGKDVRIVCFNRNSIHGYPIIALVEDEKRGEEVYYYNEFGEYDFGSNTSCDLVLEVPEEAPEEQHPIEESELYQAGYKVGFEAGRCVAFDEKKGCPIKKEDPKYDDVEEEPTGDGSIVFLRHKKHEFKPFDKVMVTQKGWGYWIPSIYRNQTPDGKHICIDNLEYDLCKPYEEND